MVLGGRKRSFAKKAQAAAAAAVLVAIIGAMLVSYVILVSPEERAAILDGDIDSDSDSTGSSGELLLEEFPGKIEYLSVDEVEHSLASVHIYTETEVQTLTERSSLFAKRSVFSWLRAFFNPKAPLLTMFLCCRKESHHHQGPPC